MKSMWKPSLMLPAAMVLIGAVSSGQETQKAAAPAGRVLSPEQAQAVQSWFAPEKAAANAPVRASGTVAP